MMNADKSRRAREAVARAEARQLRLVGYGAIFLLASLLIALLFYWAGKQGERSAETLFPQMIANMTQQDKTSPTKSFTARLSGPVTASPFGAGAGTEEEAGDDTADVGNAAGPSADERTPTDTDQLNILRSSRTRSDLYWYFHIADDEKLQDKKHLEALIEENLEIFPDSFPKSCA